METETPKENVNKEKIRRILEELTMNLVDRPNECSVTITQGEQTVVYEVRVGRGEIGKIVGKKGAMAEALRTILKSLTAKCRIRGVLEIVD